MASVTTVSAHDVAAELRRRLPSLGVKKQHKLLYYCQGHHLAVYGEPLFVETISAWDMGPVVGSLWYDEKNGETAPLPIELGERELNTIGYVISRYGALNGTDLENLTHSEAPWADANKGRLPGGRTSIGNEAIERYFRSVNLSDEDATETPAPDDTTLTDWLLAEEPERTHHGQPDTLHELRRRLDGLAHA